MVVHHPENLAVIRDAPEVDVFGTTLPGSILEMTYDNPEHTEQVVTVRADREGNFIATIPLAEGFNVIEVISHHSASPEPQRRSLQLTYDSAPLRLFLTITQPEEDATVSERVLNLSGETLPGALVVVNDIIPATLDSEGRWEASILLRRGVNEINVRASHIRNVETASITVTYEP